MRTGALKAIQLTWVENSQTTCTAATLASPAVSAGPTASCASTIINANTFHLGISPINGTEVLIQQNSVVSARNRWISGKQWIPAPKKHFKNDGIIRDFRGQYRWQMWCDKMFSLYSLGLATCRYLALTSAIPNLFFQPISVPVRGPKCIDQIA